MRTLVDEAQGGQFVIGAVGSNVTVAQVDDTVAVADGAQSVGNDHEGDAQLARSPADRWARQSPARVHLSASASVGPAGGSLVRVDGVGYSKWKLVFSTP